MSTSQGSFDEVLALYINLVDQGKTQKAAQMLEDYPQHADELRNFLGDASSIHRRVIELSLAEQTPTPTFADTPRPFGRYQLEELLGAGAMGEVYRAHDPELDRIVALKLMRGTTRAAVAERFKVEGRLSAKLVHPNIARIYEVGEFEGRLFYTMEWINGFNLRQLAEGTGLEHNDAARLIAKVARATAHAHENGIIHRDIKPSNILVDRRTFQPAIADFGLAKSMIDPHELTLSHEVVGSPAYVAPEAIRENRSKLTASVDIYALGASLYHLLAGQAPVMGESVAEVLQKSLAGKIKPLRELDRNISRDLVTITAKCMDTNPHRRYPSALAVAEDIERYLRREPIQARRASAITRGIRWCQRKPYEAALLLLIATSLFTALATAAHINGLRNIAEAKRIEAENYAAETAELSNFLVEVIASPDPNQSGRQVTVASQLNGAAIQTRTKFKDNPMRRGNLLLTLAKSFDKLGLVEEAKNEYKAAIAAYSETLEPNDKRILGARRLYASVLSHSDTAESIRALLRVRDAWETHYGNAGRDFALILRDLSSSYQADSKFPLALETSRKRLAIVESSFGPDHPETLEAQRDIARSQLDLGNVKEALQIYQSAFEAIGHAGRSESVEMIDALSGLGEALRLNGNIEESIACKQCALDISNRVLGEYHPTTIVRLKGLAIGLMHDRDRDSSSLLEEYHRRCLHKFGESHRETATATAYLGMAYGSRGEKSKAIEQFRAALPKLTEFAGKDNQQTLSIEQQLANTLIDTRRFEEAEVLLRELVPKMQRVFSPGYRYTLSTERLLAKSLAGQERYSEAAAIAEQVANRAYEAFGTEDSKPFSYAYSALSYYFLGNDFPSIENFGRQCLQRFAPDNVGTPWRLHVMQSWIADAMLRGGETKEAIPLLTEAIDNLVRLEAPPYRIAYAQLICAEARRLESDEQAAQVMLDQARESLKENAVPASYLSRMTELLGSDFELKLMPPEELPTGSVAVGRWFVRTGPGTKNKILRVIQQDTTFTIHEVKNGWYRIAQDEWVSEKCVKRR